MLVNLIKQAWNGLLNWANRLSPIRCFFKGEKENRTRLKTWFGWFFTVHHHHRTSPVRVFSFHPCSFDAQPHPSSLATVFKHHHLLQSPPTFNPIYSTFSGHLLHPFLHPPSTLHPFLRSPPLFFNLLPPRLRQHPPSLLITPRNHPSHLRLSPPHHILLLSLDKT